MHVTCYLPVEFLTVNSETQLPGLVLLPAGDPRVPSATSWFVLEKPTGCVAAVEVEGSSYGRMAGRARGSRQSRTEGSSHRAGGPFA